MPVISIITPAKTDNERSLGWLSEMIESVQMQSFNEWELIIVNDHSKVSWKPLTSHFRDERITGLKPAHESPSVARSRNQAASRASSKLLLPVDADDKLHHAALRRFTTAWENRGKNSGIIYTDVEMFDDDTSRHYKSMPYSFDMLLKNTFMTVGCLHEKRSWERIGGWNPSLDVGLEDWEYWVHAGKLGICGFYLPEPLYQYRRHSGGRIAKLQSNTSLWNTAYQRMRALHQDLFSGRKPMGCCGGSAAPAAHKPASRPMARQDIVDQRAPINNPVSVVYVGGRKGPFGVKGVTGRRYRIPGVGKPFKVAPEDAVYLGKFNHGRDFQRVVQQ